jgi:hypothetical protein
MEIKMKKIIPILLITLSGSIFANTPIISLNLLQTNPIVIQKALASGVVFSSNQNNYQLILGGRAIAKNNNSVAAQSANSVASNLWTGENGPFVVSVGNSGQSSNSALSSNGVSYNQIVYNTRSGQIGIIVGDIIVKLKPNYSVVTLASTFNINVINNFENINTAVFNVNPGQDIFTITQVISAHPGVEFAEIDVIENFPETN